jgi:hypothetical protein
MNTQPVHTINLKTLKSWKTGFDNNNQEPILILDLHDGAHLNILLPAQSAIELGQSLQKIGQEKLRPADKKPN